MYRHSILPLLALFVNCGTQLKEADQEGQEESIP